jgi:hypothetical protein
MSDETKPTIKTVLDEMKKGFAAMDQGQTMIKRIKNLLALTCVLTSLATAQDFAVKVDPDRDTIQFRRSVAVLLKERIVDNDPIKRDMFFSEADGPEFRTLKVRSYIFRNRDDVAAMIEGFDKPYTSTPALTVRLLQCGFRTFRFVGTFHEWEVDMSVRPARILVKQ